MQDLQARLNAAIAAATTQIQDTIKEVPVAEQTVDKAFTKEGCLEFWKNSHIGAEQTCNHWHNQKNPNDHIGEYNGGSFTHQGLVARSEWGGGYSFNTHLPNPGQPAINTTYPEDGNDIGYETFPNYSKFTWVTIWYLGCKPDNKLSTLGYHISNNQRDTWQHIKQNKVPGIARTSHWTGLTNADASIGWKNGNWTSQRSNVHNHPHGCGADRNYLYAREASNPCHALDMTSKTQGRIASGSVRDAYENSQWASTKYIKGKVKGSDEAKNWNLGSLTCMYPKNSLKTANDILRYDDLANKNLIAKHDTPFGKSLLFNAACDVRVEHGVNGTKCPINKLTNRPNKYCSLVFGDKDNKATQLCRQHWLVPRMVTNPNTENNLKEAYCNQNPADDACACLTAVKNAGMLCDKTLMSNDSSKSREMYDNDILKMKGYCEFMSAQPIQPPPKCWFKPCKVDNNDHAILKTQANEYDQNAIINNQSCGDLCFNMVNINLESAEIQKSLDINFAEQKVSCTKTTPTPGNGDDFDTGETVDETDAELDTGGTNDIILDTSDEGTLTYTVNDIPNDLSTSGIGGIAGLSTNQTLMIVGGIIAFLILIGAGYMLFGRKSSSTPIVTKPVTKPVTTPVTTPPIVS